VARGVAKKKLEIARRMKAEGVSIDIITRVTELSSRELADL